MKIRIPTQDAKVGMFVDAIDGSWWLNPFWKKRFLIATARDLDRLRESGVEAVTIDDERGLGVDRAGEARAGGEPEPTPAERCDGRDAGKTGGAPAEPRFELQRATAMVEKSKREIIRMFTDARLGKAIQPEGMTSLVDEICDVVEQDMAAVLKVIRLKKKTEYTYLHSVAVSALMIALGRQLRLEEAMVRELGLAGLLHDIGKMAIPSEILEKPGRLTKDEFAQIRAHPERGRDLLGGGELSQVVEDVVLRHHEKMDGTGYPFGLRGDQISLAARMGAVCDVYDAVTSNRCYKQAWTPTEALAQMRAWDGHFDRDVLNAFMRCIAIYPPGLLVRLRSNRLGVVLHENRSDPTKAIVRAFYLPAKRRFIAPIDVRVSASLKDDSVVGIEEGDRWFGEDWPRISAATIDGIACTDTAGDTSPAVAA